MPKFQNKYRTETIRLKTWNYSNAWWYFVTICTQEHIEYFGNVVNEKMELNQLGIAVETCWKEIPVHFQNTELDYYVIMPNHIHGIIIITKTVETRHASSLQLKINLQTSGNASFLQHKNITLGNIVGSFKSAVSKQTHKIGNEEFVWQSRFYDRIIRNEKELFNIRKYIEQNPLKWEIEKDNPENIFN